MKKVPQYLSNKEWNAVYDVVEKSKMDSWFDLRRGKRRDYVYDSDNRVHIGLKRALTDVHEGADLSVLPIPEETIKVFNSVLKRFDVI